MNKVKTIFFNRDFNNLSFLIVQNIANYVFPFLIFSYLIRTIGFEKFGLVAFINAFFSYIILIVEYGFTISATKDITLSKNDTVKISKVVSTVISVKLFLFFICNLILFATYSFNSHLRENFNLYLMTSLFAFGQAFLPGWFFQGIQILKNMTITSVGVKIIQTLLIFILIKNPGDTTLLQAINAFSSILILLILYFTMFKKYNFKFRLVTITEIKLCMKDSWHLFLSNVSVTFYTNTVSVLLGFFHGNLYVGYYSAAEKLILSLKALISPISQIVFPKMIALSKISKEAVVAYNKKLLKYGTPLFAVIGIFIILLSKYILLIVFGKYNPNSDLVLQILAFLPLILFLHSVFALCTLLVFSENKIYFKIILSAGLLNIFVGSVFIYYFKDLGAAIVVMSIEIYILIRYIIATEKRGYSLLKF